MAKQEEAGMEFLGLRQSDLKASEFINSTGDQVKAWLSLLALATGRLYGGRIVGAGGFTDREWIIHGLVTDRERELLKAPSLLWTWLDDGDLQVELYPTAQERLFLDGIVHGVISSGRRHHKDLFEDGAATPQGEAWVEKQLKQRLPWVPIGYLLGTFCKAKAKAEAQAEAQALDLDTAPATGPALEELAGAGAEIEIQESKEVEPTSREPLEPTDDSDEELERPITQSFPMRKRDGTVERGPMIWTELAEVWEMLPVEVATTPAELAAALDEYAAAVKAKKVPVPLVVDLLDGALAWVLAQGLLDSNGPNHKEVAE